MSLKNGRNPKSPSFQFYPGDFLADPKVQAMTAAEIGAYMLLLCAQWMDGPLPDDHKFLARVSRMTTGEFDLAWLAVGRCFKPDPDGRLSNPRLERERTNLEAFKAKCREDGAKGWAEREQKRREARATPVATPPGPLQGPLPPVSRIPDPVSLPENTRASRPPPSAPDIPVPAKALKVRKPPTDRHAEFVAWWSEVFERVVGSKYGFQGGKDGAHVKRILERAEPPEVQRRAMILLTSPPGWIAAGGIDLGTLDSQWNKLASAGHVQAATGAKQIALDNAMNGNGHVPANRLSLLDMPRTANGRRMNP